MLKLPKTYRPQDNYDFAIVNRNHFVHGLNPNPTQQFIANGFELTEGVDKGSQLQYKFLSSQSYFDKDRIHGINYGPSRDNVKNLYGANVKKQLDEHNRRLEKSELQIRWNNRAGKFKVQDRATFHEWDRNWDLHRNLYTSHINLP